MSTAQKGKRPNTLCNRCANAVPNEFHHCPWSEEGKPVRGWAATRSDILVQKYKAQRPAPYRIESHVVHSCPLFQPDSLHRTPADLNPRGLERLSVAVAVQAAEDYRIVRKQAKACPRDHEATCQLADLERFFLGGWGGMLTHGTGEDILSRLQTE